MRQRDRGFSLIELVVVIAIIAVLAALLVPATRTVREGALGVRCASGLRQIGAAADVYSSDSNRMVVPSYTGSVYWFSLLADYTDEKNIIGSSTKGRVLRGCPRYLNSAQLTALLAAGTAAYNCGYSETYNLQSLATLSTDASGRYPWGVTFVGSWNSSTVNNPRMKVTRVSERPYFWDNAHDSTEVLGWNTSAGCVANLQRHNGRGNALYFDGHVQSGTFAEINRAQGLGP